MHYDCFIENNSRSRDVRLWTKAKKVGKATAIATPGLLTGLALSALALLFIMPAYLQTSPLAPAARLLVAAPRISTTTGILLLSTGCFIEVVSGYYLRGQIRKASLLASTDASS